MTIEKIFRGVVVILFKKTETENLFLVVENTVTGNVSFMSGGEEDIDGGLLIKTAEREIKEELNLESGLLNLIPTDVFHEFVFNSKKVERAGMKASYQIFLDDATNLKSDIIYTEELKSAKWMTKNEVMENLTFPELKELFEKAIEIL